MKLIRYECDVCQQEMKGEPLILSYGLGGHTPNTVKKDVCSFKCARLGLIAFTNSLETQKDFRANLIEARTTLSGLMVEIADLIGRASE